MLEMVHALGAAGSPGLLLRMKLWVEGFAASPAASAWLFVFAFAESSFFPIPPDALLIALCLTDGALASAAATAYFAWLCTVASAAGGAFGYLIGARAGRPVLRKLASPETVASAERLLQRYDVWAVGAAGFTPIPYKIFTIASGVLRVRFGRFMAVSVASRGARFFLVAFLCHALGEGVNYVLRHHLGWATVAFFVVLVAGFYLLRCAARGLARPDRSAEEAGRRE
jgi:membrane protein YqaA with SNARE-associated domain